MTMTPQLAIEIVAKATLLLATATLVAWAVRANSAALRRAVWAAALTGLLALPLLVWLLPSWHVGVSKTSPGGGESSLATTPFRASEAELARPLGSTESERPTLWTGALALWMIGSAGVGLWIVGGIAGSRRLRRQGRRAEPAHLFAALARARQRAGVTQNVRLALHDDLHIPVVIGWQRPVVVLPQDAETWTEARLERVLVHELAHIRRADNLFHLVGRLACALFWFHPLIWFAARRLKIEREHAADDVVLATGTPASEYAEDLLAAARDRRGAGLLAAVALVGGASIGARIAAIVDERTRRAPASRRARAAAGALAAAVVLPLACASPNASPDAPPDRSVTEDTEPLATFDADGATVDLLGAELPESVERGEAIVATLYWRVHNPFPEISEPEDRWRVFVHIDEVLPQAHPGQRINADHRVDAPGAWWEDASIVEDRFAVVAGHDDYPPGDYAVFVGWFRGGPDEWTNADLVGGEPPRDPLDHDRFRVGEITLR